jgi:hypothetical protein
VSDGGPARLLRALWTVTLLAGAVGVVRQRSEARRVRTGDLEPDGPDGDRPPDPTYHPVTALLAGWVPAPPRTLAGQWAATLWSAPLTAVGLAVATASGARPRWDADRRCLVATGVGGPSSAALRLVGAGANTIGQVVLCRSDAPSRALLDHEAVHVRQAERLGPLLVPLYLWCNALRGYRDNPLEHAARRGARAAAIDLGSAARAGSDDDGATGTHGPLEHT